MSTKIINLRRARKSRERAEKRAQGDRNATVHGLRKEVSDLASAKAALEARKLDGHKADDD